MSRATRAIRRCAAPPQRRADLGFVASYSSSEADLLSNGLVPESMDEKWFVFQEGEWLNFHRSWTGVQIYAIRLQLNDDQSFSVSESWVNREPEQYSMTDIDYDRKLLAFLIDALLLKRKTSFPVPSQLENGPAGAFQHLMAGTGYEESTHVSGVPPEDA